MSTTHVRTARAAKSLPSPPAPRLPSHSFFAAAQCSGAALCGAAMACNLLYSTAGNIVGAALVAHLALLPWEKNGVSETGRLPPEVVA